MSGIPDTQEIRDTIAALQGIDPDGNPAVIVPQAAAAVQCMTMLEMTETLEALVAGVGDLLELLKRTNATDAVSTEKMTPDQAESAAFAGGLELEQLHRKLAIACSAIQQYRHDQATINTAIYQQLAKLTDRIEKLESRVVNMGIDVGRIDDVLHSWITRVEQLKSDMDQRIPLLAGRIDKLEQIVNQKS